MPSRGRACGKAMSVPGGFHADLDVIDRFEPRRTERGECDRASAAHRRSAVRQHAGRGRRSALRPVRAAPPHPPPEPPRLPSADRPRRGATILLSPRPGPPVRRTRRPAGGAATEHPAPRQRHRTVRRVRRRGRHVEPRPRPQRPRPAQPCARCPEPSCAVAARPHTAPAALPRSPRPPACCLSGALPAASPAAAPALPSPVACTTRRRGVRPARGTSRPYAPPAAATARRGSRSGCG